ncbi:hypothetical protein LIER_12170 [Lithospermum erythrorhizon]|uniref:Nuclear matrix constituent protein 1-like protein n=1 Tax=Lithospermum erythrorhizon TaxID=34254 RepID=A0AAV3PTQ3_LITER
MFTPQKSLFSRWSSSPRTEPGARIGSGSGLVEPGKGQGLALLGSAPRGLMPREDYGALDKDALADKLSELENELFDYQYNMGLLLIEKKEWTSKYDELSQALAEANDILKREQAAYSIAMSEIERREENLKKALGVEKECVLDLEKTLRDMRADHAGIKFTADSKLAEANALVTSVEEKSMEIEAKIRAGDAKLAEVSRKTSEIERRSREVEAQENSLRRERSFFNAEREAQEVQLAKQREDLREWEKKLQEAEERLAEGRRLLNQREQMANENDRILKEKHNDIEAAQKKIDTANIALKKKEDDINSRIASLSLKEKEADTLKTSLEMKERNLIEFEQQLNAREKVEMQKLLDEHNAMLDSKKKEFELEIEAKRRSIDDELKDKISEVEKKEAELNHMEDKVRKREEALEKKLEKIKEREKDIDSKSKILKEKEKVLKAEAKEFEIERNNLVSEKERLDSLKAELEKMNEDVEKELSKIREEKEQLKVTEEERLEHARLQAELKEEIEKCRGQNELLVKQAEDLKQERDSFEKEWEKLDERRVEISKELEEIAEQRRNFEKLQHSVEEKLNMERLETQNFVKSEREALQMEKDTFAAKMELEQRMLDEKIQSERSQMVHDFELRKRELETEMQRKQEEMEFSLQEQEKLFKEKKERILEDINHMKEVSQREMKEMEVEGSKLEKEKEEVLSNKKRIEVQQSELREDIEQLVNLSKKLKQQREQFMKERERFISFIEMQKNCSSCGDVIREFWPTDLKSITEIDTVDAPLLPSFAEDYLRGAGNSTPEQRKTKVLLGDTGSPASGGTVSWLRKCTSKILRLSPGKKLEKEVPQDLIGQTSSPLKELAASDMDPEPLLKADEDPSDANMREAEAGREVSEDRQRNISSCRTQDIQEDSKNRKVQQRPAIRYRLRAHKTLSSMAVSADTEGDHVGGGAEDGGNLYGNDVENSSQVNEGSRGESNLDGQRTLRNGKKRNRPSASQLTVSEDNHDEGHSDSITTGGRKKRKQKPVPSVQSQGGERYNLRRRRTEAAVKDNGSLPVRGKGKKKAADSRNNGANNSQSLLMPSEEFDASRGSGGDMSHSQAAPIGDPSVAGHDFSTNNPEDTSGNQQDEIVSGEEMRTPERTQQQETGEGDEDDCDDEDVDHPGQASIGKKLWTFLTT